MLVICHHYLTLLTLELCLCLHRCMRTLLPLSSHRALLPSPSSPHHYSHSCVYPHDAPSPPQQVLSYVLTLRTYMFILTLKKLSGLSIVVLLTLIKFTMTCRTQKAFRHGICRHISHMQTSIRLLYVFYRDGTLLLVLWVLFARIDCNVIERFFIPLAPMLFECSLLPESSQSWKPLSH